MEAFTLDTTGYVQCLAPDQKPNETTGIRYWSDLSPFVQGYVEALFASADADLRWQSSLSERDDRGRRKGFSDLSPEALALILRDCEARTGDYNRLELFTPNDPPSADDGRAFWEHRQTGDLRPKYPPLTPYLSDDGRVNLGETK